MNHKGCLSLAGGMLKYTFITSSSKKRPIAKSITCSSKKLLVTGALLVVAIYIQHISALCTVGVIKEPTTISHTCCWEATVRERSD